VSALPAPGRDLAGSGPAAEWAQIAPAAPLLAATMRRYLGQLGTFLAPASVAAADSVLRQFARWLLATTTVTTVATISRDDLEDFKVWLAARPGEGAGRLSASTFRQRLQALRMFFERITEAGLAGRAGP
jgi:site-specific recombinase XerD